MTTALSKWGNTQDLSAYQSYESAGMDSLNGTEYLQVPSLAIAQPTSEHRPEGSYFINSTDEDLGDSVWIVLLQHQRKMEYRPGGSYDSPRTCFSHNFFRPSPDSPDLQNAQCHERSNRSPRPICPLARWKTEDGQRVPPPCQEKWVFAVAIVEPANGFALEPDRTALLHLERTKLAPARSFLKQFRTILRRMPLFGVAIELKLEYKNDGGKYYIPDFPDLRKDDGRVKLIPPAHLAEYNEQCQFFKDFLVDEDSEPRTATTVAPLQPDVVTQASPSNQSPQMTQAPARTSSHSAQAPSGSRWGNG